MWQPRFIYLHLVVLLAWSHIVCSQDPTDPEDPGFPELQCASLCCGDPVTIPSEEDFQLLIIPFETVDQAVFPTSITKEQALGNLSEDFLQPETIEEIATFTSNYFQVDASSLDPFSSSRCDIPLSNACLVQRCGCNARRRTLLQCFPVLGCSASGTGAIEDGNAEPAPLPPPLILGICLMDTCTLFQIQPVNAANFDFALDSTCPDILPVAAPATLTEPTPSTETSLVSSTDATSPPPPSPPPPSPPPPSPPVSTETTSSTTPSPPPPPPRIRAGLRGRVRDHVKSKFPGLALPG
ncbi:hypothetical protein BSKO_12348 [Bryopsis sp. KO-2023]|nr:hypothetical protein BSKO_12348 [Bryopsis sp. KO-2023]